MNYRTIREMFVAILLIFFPQLGFADFFQSDTDLIDDNTPRLSYGVAVTDFNDDGKSEFIVTGFGFSNLALGMNNGRLMNMVRDEIFADKSRRTIGVAACDVNGDGKEELYFLNTDTFSGAKKLGDRLLSRQAQLIDMFELTENLSKVNLVAGRSVACVDRQGNGYYGIYVSNYGGPSRMYEVDGARVDDLAPGLGLDAVTGGRAVIAGHILGSKIDIFASNERGPNFLYHNKNGKFYERATFYGLDDALQNGRGTALADVLYDGRLGIISGNWNGFHRVYVPFQNSFVDYATKEFKEPSKIRTVIVADFDNDGFDEIFINNIGEPNRLFRIEENGSLKQLKLLAALESSGLGTGAAVADTNNDGVLELLIAHGETAPQPLSLFTAKISASARYVRFAPRNMHNAPARGATVILKTNQRNHAKTIDAGSGYLCQMEPVAHYGLRPNEKIEKVTIRWTNGSLTSIGSINENETLTIRQTF